MMLSCSFGGFWLWFSFLQIKHWEESAVSKHWTEHRLCAGTLTKGIFVSFALKYNLYFSQTFIPTLHCQWDVQTVMLLFKEQIAGWNKIQRNNLVDILACLFGTAIPICSTNWLYFIDKVTTNWSMIVNTALALAHINLTL